jgi:hypothetical protein
MWPALFTHALPGHFAKLKAWSSSPISVTELNRYDDHAAAAQQSPLAAAFVNVGDN